MKFKTFWLESFIRRDCLGDKVINAKTILMWSLRGEFMLSF
jgi:hypothetical protein